MFSSSLKIILPLLVVIVHKAVSISEDDLRHWLEFKEQFNKNYRTRDLEIGHLRTFLSNKRLVEQHNKRYNAGHETYELGINHLADLTVEQVFGTSLLNSSYAFNNAETYSVVTRESDPESVDWRAEGLVTPVKNQGQCGSCYAFSAVAAMESAWKVKTGQLPSLSEQFLVDCSKTKGNNGCNGGLMDKCFQYVIEQDGITDEQSYPYEAKDVNGCRNSKAQPVAKMQKYYRVKKGEKNLKTVVANAGVVSVAIHATRNFMLYKKGIFSDDTCNSRELNHGVASVGYGVENNKKYWIIKNSFGTNWGESGYMYMIRDRNMCGISTMASFPMA